MAQFSKAFEDLWNDDGPHCFIAGTLIPTEDGLRPTEEIKVGQLVYSENPETGEKGLKKVVRTVVSETDELIHVSVDGQTIVTTPEHPFYVPVRGWIKAINLRAGDTLVTVNGEYKIVEEIQHEILETPVKVYNFEVEDFHTYYVSDLGVLVHNSCGDTWGNPDTLEDHYKRHGEDVGATSAEDYAEKANDFYKNRDNYEVKVDKDGTTRVYDSKTNTFGSYNKNGTTKTFFKPKAGEAYFKRQ